MARRSYRVLLNAHRSRQGVSASALIGAHDLRAARRTVHAGLCVRPQPRRLVSVAQPASARSIQHAAYNTQHTTRSIQHAAYNTQHTTRSIQHAAYNTQHTTRSIQHAAYNTQHTTCSIQCAAYNAQHTTRSIQCSAYGVRHATYVAITRLSGAIGFARADAMLYHDRLPIHAPPHTRSQQARLDWVVLSGCGRGGGGLFAWTAVPVGYLRVLSANGAGGTATHARTTKDRTRKTPHRPRPQRRRRRGAIRRARAVHDA
jgi:hypothetical protein